MLAKGLFLEYQSYATISLCFGVNNQS